MFGHGPEYSGRRLGNRSATAGSFPSRRNFSGSAPDVPISVQPHEFSVGRINKLTAPKPPKFFALPPEWVVFGERAAPAPGPFRPLSRRSGCVPAVPYPPLRYSQSGRHQPRRATIFCRTAITLLTRCLTPGVHFTLSAAPSPLPLLSNHVRNVRCERRVSVNGILEVGCECKRPCSRWVRFHVRNLLK